MNCKFIAVYLWTSQTRGIVDMSARGFTVSYSIHSRSRSEDNLNNQGHRTIAWENVNRSKETCLRSILKSWQQTAEVGERNRPMTFISTTQYIYRWNRESHRSWGLGACLENLGPELRILESSKSWPKPPRKKLPSIVSIPQLIKRRFILQPYNRFSHYIGI